MPGDQRPGGHELSNGHRHCLHGFHPHRRHHRAGPDGDDRQRRVPGGRHHRHHHPDHQAQLPDQGRDRAPAHRERGVLHCLDRQTGAGAHRLPQGHAERDLRLRRTRRRSSWPATGLPTPATRCRSRKPASSSRKPSGRSSTSAAARSRRTPAKRSRRWPR